MLAESVLSFTVVLVGSVRVTVDGAGLPVCGPAGVCDAKVCVQLCVKIDGFVL